MRLEQNVPTVDIILATSGIKTMIQQRRRLGDIISDRPRLVTHHMQRMDSSGRPPRGGRHIAVDVPTQTRGRLCNLSTSHHRDRIRPDTSQIV
jgi:hypothetical protein